MPEPLTTPDAQLEKIIERLQKIVTNTTPADAQDEEE